MLAWSLGWELWLSICLHINCSVEGGDTVPVLCWWLELPILPFAEQCCLSFIIKLSLHNQQSHSDQLETVGGVLFSENTELALSRLSSLLLLSSCGYDHY